MLKVSTDTSAEIKVRRWFKVTKIETKLFYLLQLLRWTQNWEFIYDCLWLVSDLWDGFCSPKVK